jgi:hypothetical protein
MIKQLAQPIELIIEQEDQPLHDLFNDLSATIIKRSWYQELWTTDEWAAILRFDASWRAATEKYNKLPPWRQFWASSAGNTVAAEAASLARVLGV